MGRTRGERLREARSKLFESARKAAAALGIPPATYTAHERAETPGGRDYGPDEARIYARRFHVTPEWLLTGKGTSDSTDFEEEPEQRTIRVVGYVGAGAETHYYAVAQGDLDEVPAPDNASDSTVAVEVRGDSLGSLFDRWLVFYDEVRSPVTSDLIGRLCVVGLSDNRVLIKKIRRNSHGGYDLLSNTQEPIRDQQIAWAARVKNMAPR